MTTEQKEAFLNSWFGSLPECSSHWANGMSGNLVDEVSSRFDEAIQAYTRAIPDVPELVRYSVRLDEGRYFGMAEYAGGKYVLHSQAAEIIAAKDAEINKLNVYNGSYHNQITELRELLQAAEAKVTHCDELTNTVIELRTEIGVLRDNLAQIEKQEAVAWSIIFSPHYGVNPETTFKTRERAEAYIAGCSRGKLVALYTAPVAGGADLRAENEDLRGYAARIIAAFDEDNDLDNPEKFNAYFDLKAALNPSELRI